MKKRKMLTLFGSICLTIILGALPFMAACGPAAPAAESPADFFKNNTVTIVCPMPPGGSWDYASRVFAGYWHDATGGTMVVDNVEGGGGLAGTNNVYAAKPDGLTLGLGMYSSIMFIPVLMDDPGVKFDINKWSWIGAFIGQPYFLEIGAKSPVGTVEDLKKTTGLKFGIAAIKGISAMATTIVIDSLGLKEAKIIAGLAAVDISLALARGEIDGSVYTASQCRESIAKGFVKDPPLVVVDFERSAEWFPKTPALTEVATLSPKQERWLRLYKNAGTEYAIFGPPGLPEDRLQFTRDAFDKIMGMQGFQQQCKLQWIVLPPPIKGKDLAASVMKAMQAAPKEDFTELSQLTEKYVKYGTQ